MKKRSMTVAGHRASLTLEDEFWHELRILAEAEGVTMNALVTRVDAGRDLKVNLSNALRLYVLKALNSR